MLTYRVYCAKDTSIDDCVIVPRVFDVLIKNDNTLVLIGENGNGSRVPVAVFLEEAWVWCVVDHSKELR